MACLDHANLSLIAVPASRTDWLRSFGDPRPVHASASSSALFYNFQPALGVLISSHRFSGGTPGAWVRGCLRE